MALYFGSLGFRVLCYPKSPCTQIVYTLAHKYLYRDYFKATAEVYTRMENGPLGLHQRSMGLRESTVGGCHSFSRCNDNGHTFRVHAPMEFVLRP